MPHSFLGITSTRHDDGRITRTRNVPMALLVLWTIFCLVAFLAWIGGKLMTAQQPAAPTPSNFECYVYAAAPDTLVCPEIEFLAGKRPTPTPQPGWALHLHCTPNETSSEATCVPVKEERTA